ncbi:hypothetical protein [Methylobacterium planeticum]|uniref:hypothetical protein n=1 Tax=Methylobacterium planeticum TaxID=2615211 RepID=UPI001FED8962|nr:hypothetical protein [Methylobacterium planeticum]
MALERFSNVVAGRACASTTGRWLTTANPFDGRDWAEVPRCGSEDAAAASTRRAATRRPSSTP